MLTAANAHNSDVNVIDWNPNEPFLASGGDDNMLKIWDLRSFDKGIPVATFKHHTQPGEYDCGILYASFRQVTI